MEDGRKLQLLRELDLFAGLSDDQVDEIARLATIGTYRRQTVLMTPSDPPERIHIVKRGRVRMYRLTADGKELTLGIFEAGTILGGMRLVGQDQIPGTWAEAVDEVTICTVTPDELLQFIKRYPTVGINIIRHLAQRLEEAEQQLEDLAYRPVDQRLAAKLTELAQRFGTRTESGILIGVELTQQALAETIGTSRETLATALGRLRNRGIVAKQGRQIVVCDADALRSLAARE